MSTKRNYPLFMIDRSKPDAYPFDYIVCHDQAVGFTARVVFFPKTEQYQEYIRQSEKVAGNETVQMNMPFKNGGIILVIEDFFHYFEWTTENRTRIATLLKKAMKKYLHAERERTPGDGLGLDDQIKQQQLTIERAEQNYADLVHRANGDKSVADYQIDLAKATLNTLKQYKHNMEYFKTVMN